MKLYKFCLSEKKRIDNNNKTDLEKKIIKLIIVSKLSLYLVLIINSKP
jgi:hypothetical protein